MIVEIPSIDQALETVLYTKAKEAKIIKDVNVSLEITLKAEDVFEISMEDDGNCLYYSVEYFYDKNSNSSALELRDEVLNYMAEYPHKVLGGVTIMRAVVSNFIQYDKIGTTSDEVV